MEKLVANPYMSMLVFESVGVNKALVLYTYCLENVFSKWFLSLELHILLIKTGEICSWL